MRRLVGAALAAALFFPTVARADEIARETTALAVLDAVDMVSTRARVREGWTERNGLPRPFIKSDASALVYFATSALVSDVIGHALYRKSPTLARAYMADQIVSEFSASVDNMTRARNSAPIIFHPPTDRRKL